MECLVGMVFFHFYKGVIFKVPSFAVLAGNERFCCLRPWNVKLETNYGFVLDIIHHHVCAGDYVVVGQPLGF